LPEAFQGCLVPIDILSDDALDARLSTIGKLLDEIRIEEKTATSAYHKCALSAVANYCVLLDDQARMEMANRKDQIELERYRQILAGVGSLSIENDKDSELNSDCGRLLNNIEDIEHQIGLRQSVRMSVEGQLSALSAHQIDSYLAFVGVPAHDPLRLSINGQTANDSKATENTSEPSVVQDVKTFAAETFIDLTDKYPKHGVPAEALKPFAAECDARRYLLTSDFLRDRVCKAIKEYNIDFPQAQIKNYTDLVETLRPVPVSANSVKKRLKNSRQKVARQFRVWLYEMKRDYLKKSQRD